ncbi:MAG: alpha/beta hydrolase, partial [Simkaniaceae bacterium]|nr:alpha/beta hydrolase [Simkaniaceae bacterium]
ILYKAKNPKGIVLYYPGQQRNRSTNGEQIADTFVPMDHDVLVMDYRGAGKSTGQLSYQKVLADAKLFYDFVNKRYPEEQISVYGRSLGTGIATYIATQYHPKCLILEAPYFNLLDMAKLQHPYLPSIILPMMLKYRLRTNHWIQSVECPIHIFHGTHDRVIPHHSSHRLQNLIDHKANSTLTIIDNTNHKTVSENEIYFGTIAQILEN